MILSSPEEQKKEAFRLFEDGRYQESLAVCNRLLSSGKDPALEVLAATNLFYTGRHEDAEVFFRDLAVRMPDSSYVHSYLAKVLEARGDEGAIAEYAAAVHLDPTNQDAVRSYAEYLLSRADYRGALPALRRLAQRGKMPGDVRNLIRALAETGATDEALATRELLGEGAARSPEYIHALMKADRYGEAAEAAYASWRGSADPTLLRTWLGALARCDLQKALGAYTQHLEDTPDAAILSDYLDLLRTAGDLSGARTAAERLVALCPKDPSCRLALCNLLAGSGDVAGALAAYEGLVQDELAARDDREALGRVLGSYRRFLTGHLPAADAERRFLDLVSRDLHAASLLETARLYEDMGRAGDARSWYYRAYRADFLVGGPDYALFLARTGEDRECEKVMLYILANVRKGADLTRIASIILAPDGRMHPMKRLMDQLIRKLDEKRETLGTDGLDLLAAAFFRAATHALDAEDYAGCKYFCLSGIDVMPAHAQVVRPGDFLALVRQCKEQTLADRPVMHERGAQVRHPAVPPAESVAGQLGLDEQEQKIVSFLRSHRKASEMELRTLLGTRRVVGIVNRLVQKAAAGGVSLIVKKGMGEEGEIYEYTGS